MLPIEHCKEQNTSLISQADFKYKPHILHINILIWFHFYFINALQKKWLYLLLSYMETAMYRGVYYNDQLM